MVPWGTNMNIYFIVRYICNLLSSNLGDWVVTAVVTYFSVKIATKKYYHQNTKSLIRKVLSNEMRRLMQVDVSEQLSDSSLAVLVEYKGTLKQSMEDKGAPKGSPARRTVVSIGGDQNNTRKINPRDYGVLGVANYIKYPALVDFQNRKVYYYLWGSVHVLSEVEVPEYSEFWGINIDVEDIHIKKHFVARKQTHREVMIALPIVSKGELVGGITFDFPLYIIKCIFQ